MSEGHISFEWTPVETDCPAVSYEVITINCGLCSADVTYTSNVTCNPLSTRYPSCKLNVTTKSNVCGNALEAMSELTIQIKEGTLISLQVQSLI